MPEPKSSAKSTHTMKISVKSTLYFHLALAKAGHTVDTLKLRR
jgi:hypothetical protein